MKRFLPVAVIVALVGVIVAVVVIDGGDEGRTKQPSVEQQVSPADEVPAGLRDLLGRKLDQTRSVECGAGRGAPSQIRELGLPPDTVGCVIRFRPGAFGGQHTSTWVNTRGRWGLVVRMHAS